MAEWVWMHNAETGGTQRFAAEAVDAWRDMGWEPCDPPASPNQALDPNHPALAQVAHESAMASFAAGMRRAKELTHQKFAEPAPEGGEAFIPQRREADPPAEQTTGGTTSTASKRSTGRAPASDKEE